MDQPPPRRSHFALPLLSVAVILSLVAVYLGIARLSAGRRDAVRLAEDQTTNLARATSQNISATLRRIDHVLLSLCGEIERDLARGPFDARKVRQTIDFEQRLLPEAVAVRVADRDGRVIVNNPSDNPAASFADKPYFPYLRDRPDAGTFVTKPIIGAFTGKWVITSARRFNRPDGTFGGVVVIPVFVDQFQRGFSGFDLPPGGVLTLRDTDGRFVTRHPIAVKGETLTVGDARISGELRALLASSAKEKTYTATVPFDRAVRAVTFRRVEGAPLVVLAAVLEEDYLAPWRKDRVLVVGLLCAFLAVTWGASAWLWRSWRSLERGGRALRASEEKYRRVFENDLYPMIMFDAETLRVVDVNEAHVRLYGYSREELLRGVTGPDLSAEPEASLQTLQELQRKGTTLVPLRYHRKKDGTVFPVELFLGRYSMGGRPVFFAMGRDITERKNAEDALRRAHDELEARVRERTAEVEAAKSQLELDIKRREKAESEKALLEARLRQSQILEAVGRLAGGVAHDFNNLLASVLSCAWVARVPEATTEDVRRELERIEALCKEGGEVTRQLLAVASHPMGTSPSIDLTMRLKQLRPLVERACPKTVSVVFGVASDLPRVSGDRGLLTSAILNVCLNAKDAMPDGGTLTVRAVRREREGKDWAVISVTDTGEGIPRELQNRIFQPFFSTKFGERGTGLGLSTALATANSMGGSLDLVSEVGHGSTFTFSLPASTCCEEPPISPHGGLSESGFLGARGAKVLVVEDEDDIARFVEEVFVRWGGRVLRARTGLEALEIVRANEDGLELILLDLVLPELSGVTLHRTLAAVAPHIPVVFMTGRDDLATKADPTVALLRKPFSEVELVECARRAVRVAI